MPTNPFWLWNANDLELLFLEIPIDPQLYVPNLKWVDKPVVFIPAIELTFAKTLTIEDPTDTWCSAKYTLSKKVFPTPTVSGPEDVVFIPVTPSPIKVFLTTK